MRAPGGQVFARLGTDSRQQWAVFRPLRGPLHLFPQCSPRISYNSVAADHHCGHMKLTCVYIHIYIYIYINRYIVIYTEACTDLNSRLCVCIYIYIYAHTHTCTHVLVPPMLKMAVVVKMQAQSGPCKEDSNSNTIHFYDAHPCVSLNPIAIKPALPVRTSSLYRRPSPSRSPSVYRVKTYRDQPRCLVHPQAQRKHSGGQNQAAEVLNYLRASEPSAQVSGIGYSPPGGSFLSEQLGYKTRELQQKEHGYLCRFPQRATQLAFETWTFQVRGIS